MCPEKSACFHLHGETSTVSSYIKSGQQTKLLTEKIFILFHYPFFMDWFRYFYALLQGNPITTCCGHISKYIECDGSPYPGFYMNCLNKLCHRFRLSNATTFLTGPPLIVGCLRHSENTAADMYQVTVFLELQIDSLVLAGSPHLFQQSFFFDSLESADQIR